ncbi:hypothetical protein A7K99_12875 [Tatumella citrea]|uniref:Uncharacterized protein n=1 Tax=Tatumella citrea TaxID=53336 RepID=A0A1Y0LAB8_TATCI|nr:hypothetical protein A7K98_12885 [Tatumella citrea]ARU98616.1 hypothetical protein A7K99_12875 [Tatumella citrea]
MRTGKHYVESELEYLRRVAGKVPIPVISKSLKRTENSVVHKAQQMKLSLTVPKSVLLKHWPEYLRGDDV